LSTSASTSERWQALSAAWGWLHPQLFPASGPEPGSWPLDPEKSRDTARLLLAEARDLLEHAGAGSQASHEASRRWGIGLIEREEQELNAARSTSWVADHLSAGLLGPLRHGTRTSLKRALDSLPAWLDLCVSQDLVEEETGAAESLKQRLTSLQQHLERKLLEMDEAELAGKVRVLESFHDRLRITAFQPADVSQAAAGLQAKDLEKLDDAIQRLNADIERRIKRLDQRYLGKSETAEANILALIELDQGRPEQWAASFNRRRQELDQELALRGMPAHRQLRFQVEPGLYPGFVELAPATWHRSWNQHGRRLPDLSLLDPLRLEAHLIEWNHVRQPLELAARHRPGSDALLELWGQAPHPAAFLLRDGDTRRWSDLAPGWLLDQGWMGGERRLRLLQKRQELRLLKIGRIDLLRLLAVRPDDELEIQLFREARLPEHALKAVWQKMLAEPGHFAFRALDGLALADRMRSLKKSWQDNAGSEDTFSAMQQFCLMPREVWPQLAEAYRPSGRSLPEPPPALPRPREDQEGLLSEVEQRLAELGRIRKEDLLAGSEFDGGAPAVDDTLAAAAEALRLDPPEGGDATSIADDVSQPEAKDTSAEGSKEPDHSPVS
jgi:hypothetical protein